VRTSFSQQWWVVVWGWLGWMGGKLVEDESVKQNSSVQALP